MLELSCLLRIVNYYPAAAGWTRMWTSYSHPRTAADFRAIRSLGANTVRLLLDRGADIDARDTTWNSTPLVWAAIWSRTGSSGWKTRRLRRTRVRSS